jgi:uncharacterized membrane protein YdjX (TVP38/TMEM64 family)
MKLDRKKIGAITVLLAVIAFGGLLYAWLGAEAVAFIRYAVNEETQPALFLLMFVFLPLIGFPITAFLILIGVKFGAWAGVLIMLVGMPVHLVVAFLAAHSFLHSLIQRYLKKFEFRLPQVPSNRGLCFSFVFMAVPGLSYTLKNYALALSGVPFRYFFTSGYLVQGAMGVPFVIAGDAVAGKSLALLGAILGVLLILYGLVYLLRHKRNVF